MHQLIISLQTGSLLPEEIPLLQDPHIDGLIFFQHHFTDQKQFKKLIENILSVRADLNFYVDYEGGYIQRFIRNGIRCWPAARIYGEIYDSNPDLAINLAHRYASEIGTMLKSFGGNWINFAPILDLHNNNRTIGILDRAFHTDPFVVEKLAAAFMLGLHDVQVGSCAKHFPGHSACLQDSHIEKSITHSTLSELETTHLLPFLNLIKNNVITSIMPAHIIFPQIDADLPVGLSKIWLQDILRKKYGFQGIIISDDLTMVGADIGDMSMRIQQALNAGCDKILVCNQELTAINNILKYLHNVPYTN